MSAGSALASTGTLATSKTPNDKTIDFTGAAQTHSSGTGSKDEQALKEFIVEYVRAVASNDVSKQDRCFADPVNLYAEEAAARATVQASTRLEWRDWPLQQWAPRGETRILHSGDSNLYEAVQSFAWTASNGFSSAQGSATLYFEIRENTGGEFQIVKVEQHN